MLNSKNLSRLLGAIVLILLFVLLNSTLANEKTVSGKSKKVVDNPKVASILQKHISDLNNQSTIHLNQSAKEEFVQMAMCLNYLVVLAIASFIVFRTRVMRPQAKKVLRLRH